MNEPTENNKFAIDTLIAAAREERLCSFVTKDVKTGEAYDVLCAYTDSARTNVVPLVIMFRDADLIHRVEAPAGTHIENDGTPTQ